MVAGIAARRPTAVAISASAMPGATTARLALPACAMPWKDWMMPITVPKRPMKGAELPVVARKGSPRSSRAVSLAAAHQDAAGIGEREGQVDAGLDEDVGGAEAFDALLGFVRRALTDREHGDDRADTEDDAEHGQAGAQLVQQQALDAELDGVGERVGKLGAKVVEWRRAGPGRRQDRRLRNRRGMITEQAA